MCDSSFIREVRRIYSSLGADAKSASVADAITRLNARVESSTTTAAAGSSSSGVINTLQYHCEVGRLLLHCLSLSSGQHCSSNDEKIENIYVKLLNNEDNYCDDNGMLQQEFLSLGEALAILGTCKTPTLQGAAILLPIQPDVASHCDTERSRLSVESLFSLRALQRFWCRVLCKLRGKPLREAGGSDNASAHIVKRYLLILSSYMQSITQPTASSCEDIDIRIVTSICELLSSLVEQFAGMFDWEARDVAANGIIGGGALKVLATFLESRGCTISNGGECSRELAAGFLECCRAVVGAFEAVERCVLDKDLAKGLVNKLCSLMDSMEANRPPPVGGVASRTTILAGGGGAAGGLLSAAAVSLLSCLHCCVRTYPLLCPGVGSILSWCFDAPTQHACLSLLGEVLGSCMPALGAALAQWMQLGNAHFADGAAAAVPSAKLDGHRGGTSTVRKRARFSTGSYSHSDEAYLHNDSFHHSDDNIIGMGGDKLAYAVRELAQGAKVSLWLEIDSPTLFVELQRIVLAVLTDAHAVSLAGEGRAVFGEEQFDSCSRLLLVGELLLWLAQGSAPARRNRDGGERGVEAKLLEAYRFALQYLLQVHEAQSSSLAATSAFLSVARALHTAACSARSCFIVALQAEEEQPGLTLALADRVLAAARQVCLDGVPSFLPSPSPVMPGELSELWLSCVGQPVCLQEQSCTGRVSFPFLSAQLQMLSAQHKVQALRMLVQHIVSRYADFQSALFSSIGQQAWIVLLSDAFRIVNRICASIDTAALQHAGSDDLLRAVGDVNFVAAALLYHSFPDECAAVKRVQRAHPAMLSCFDALTDLSSTRGSEYLLLRVQLLASASKWVKSNFRGSSDSDSSHQSPSQCVWGGGLVDAFVKTWTASSSLPVGEPEVQLRMLLQVRLFCAAVDCSGGSDLTVQARVRDISQSIDERCEALLLRQGEGQAARTLLSQIICCSMQDCFHREGSCVLESVNNCSSLSGRLGSLAVSRLKRPAPAGHKSSRYVEIVALSRFVRSSALTNPVAAVWALGVLFRFYASEQAQDDLDESGDELEIDNCALLEELIALRQLNALAYLLTAHREAVVDVIVVPLLHAPGVDVDRVHLLLHSHLVVREPGRAGAERSLLDMCLSHITARVSLVPQSGGRLAAERLRSLLARRPGGGTRLVDSLIGQDSMILYHILVSDVVQRCPDSELVKGHLFEILKRCAAALGISVCEDEALFPRMHERSYLPLLWDLGSSDEHRDAALKALRVLCTLHRANAWSVAAALRGSSKSAISASSLEENVAHYIPSLFYYVMANLLQSGWNGRTQSQQEQSVKTLSELVKPQLLRQGELAKYMPKIVTFLDIVLASPSPKVRHAAVLLAAGLAKHLPTDVLSVNLPGLVVGLFPALEGGPAGSGSGEHDLALADLARRGASIDHYGMQCESKARFVGLSCGLSEDLRYVCEAAYAADIARLCGARSRASAISLLNDLYFSDRVEAKRAFQALPYLPDVSGLEALNEDHSNRVQQMPLHQSLRLLCSLLRHESSQVRLVALRRLTAVCTENILQIYQVVSPLASSGSSSVENNAVSLLLQELLLLSSRETDDKAIDECARCLGVLGAIDPMRFSSVSPHAALTSRTAGGDKVREAVDSAPWDHDPMSMGLYLLEQHLVPGLRSDAASASVQVQERVGFAIQEILRIVAGTQGTSVGRMPDKLRQRLQTSGALEVTEPFWTTRYLLDEVISPRKSPIFQRGLTFARWVGFWVRSLIYSARGPFQSLFFCLRGFVRSRNELCQALLPHLIVDNLLYSSDGEEGAQRALVLELTQVLGGGGTEDGSSNNVSQQPSPDTAVQGGQMAVQAVFVLLDTLASWAARKQALLKGRGAVAAFPWERACDAIARLLERVPKDLLGRAALRIKAYARALRYFELHARDAHRARVRMGTTALGNNPAPGEGGAALLFATRNDGSLGELPTLGSGELDELMTIFSNLEDPDTLGGIQVLRQIQGFPTKPWDRILELQQSDDWLNALLEYGLISRGADSYALPLMRLLPGKSTPDSTTRMLRSVRSHAPGAAGNAAVMMDVEAGAQRAEEVRIGALVGDEEEVERGRLRCLVELGQLEAVIEQTLGLMHSRPSLEPLLLPLGIEASWRLAQWSTLGSFITRADAIAANSIRPEDEFQVSVGALLLSMRSHDHGGFAAGLRRARLRSMKELSAASMESYGRAYPFLTRLHVLHELESGAELVNFRAIADSGVERAALLRQMVGRVHWQQRLDILSPSPRHRSTVLAVRRSMLTASGMHELVAENWLDVCKSMRQLCRFDAAKIALRNAEINGLKPSSVLIQECEILRDSGHINRAIMLLEPVEPDVAGLRATIKSNKPWPPELDTEVKRTEFSERLLLATQMKVDSKQKHGKGILERFKCVSDLRSKNETAHFELAKYFEHLYHDARARDGAKSRKGDEHITHALRHYGQCLLTGGLFLMQALPRMLSLWVSFTALKEAGEVPVNNGAGRVPGSRASSSSTMYGRASDAAPSSPLLAAQREANDMMKKIEKALPACTWFACMPQLASRTGHHNATTVQTLKSILAKVLQAFPQQGIWHIAGLSHSLSNDRRAIGRELCQDAQSFFLSTKRNADAELVQQSSALFGHLIDLAALQPKDNNKKLRWTATRDIRLTGFLVPTQAVLYRAMSIGATSGSRASVGLGGSGELMFIKSFAEDVDVASSKAKPKTITLHTVCGQTVRFLCKQEKNGDLRKDNRVMEFNTVVNRLMQDDPEGRRRFLKMRTYSVVCLNEECGILEWVNNTTCVRHLITEAHSYWPAGVYPVMSTKEVLHAMMELQTKYENDIDAMTREYRKLVTDRFKPCFHRWFIEHFPDPTEWLEARTVFIRSVAVWSAVGHVVGLGDRHTENILLDVTNGECVHVDFDCVFDKGLTLQRPEIIPFRLTPNFVDAMGLTGVEGTYRRTLEACVKVLRDNKETLLSVIEPFIRDPTVAWSRSGRAQRADGQLSKQSGAATTFQDLDNADAKEALQKISERLSGVYNIVHPHYDRICGAARGRAAPTRGVGAHPEERAMPMSVQGQVERLIVEAIAEENLVQMYVGWQPFS